MHQCCWQPGRGAAGRNLAYPLWSPPPAGDFGDTAVQGQLVHQLRYLASVVTQNFTSFGELLAMPKRFAEISGARAGCCSHEKV